MSFSRSTDLSSLSPQTLERLPYIGLLCGIVFFLAGVCVIYSAFKLTSHGQEAQLTVIKLEMRHDDGAPVYRPIFEAVRSDGIIIFNYILNCYTGLDPLEVL